MASVCRQLLLLLQILSAHIGSAQTIVKLRLRDLAPGEDFKRCVKSIHWNSMTIDDEIETYDRDATSGCCPAGWLPGTQPLVYRVQNLRGLWPYLYIYGQISCGWRNGTFGVAGSKTVVTGAKCDYGACYFVPQNFTCGDGASPLLNGCCKSGDYGNTCRRGYFFEDRYNVKEDDLFLHIACKPGTGPGYDSNPNKTCKLDYTTNEACYTRTTEDYQTSSYQYGGTQTPDDDVIGGTLQPWNIYGAQYCPPTTTTTTGNVTSTVALLFDIDPNATNFSFLNGTITTTSLPTTTTTTSTTTNTTTTSTTSTTNVTTTTSSSTTTTNTTIPATTSEKPEVVVGIIHCVVDDPVAFAGSSLVEVAARLFLAEIAGSAVSTSQVWISLTAPTSELYRQDGGRRLLGAVKMEFRIYVAPHLLDDLVHDLESTDVIVASNILLTKVRALAGRNLALNVYVRKISASRLTSTTTSTTSSYALCPEGMTCFSHSCGSCGYWLQQGLDCTRTKNWAGECLCSCMKPLPNASTPPPAGRLQDAASQRRMHVIVVMSAIAALIVAHGSRCFL